LTRAIDAAFTFIRASESAQDESVLRVIDDHLGKLLLLMEEETVIIVALAIVPLSSFDVDKCRRFLGRLAQSPKVLLPGVREWLHFQDFAVPPDIRHRLSEVAAAAAVRFTEAHEERETTACLRRSLLGQAAAFCKARSELVTRALWNKVMRAKLMSRACDLDTAVFRAVLERMRLFPFMPEWGDIAMKETVFCVVYQCAPGSATRVKVEICALLGDCLMWTVGDEVLLVHSFGQQNPAFEIVFDEAGEGCERFNGHVVYRFRKDALKKGTKGQMVQRGTVVIYIYILKT
jgi:hypothetical protein